MGRQLSKRFCNHSELYSDFLDKSSCWWYSGSVEVNDAKLLALASDRMAKADFAAFVPAESFYKEFGITQDSLDKTDEVDIG